MQLQPVAGFTPVTGLGQKSGDPDHDALRQSLRLSNPLFAGKDDRYAGIHFSRRAIFLLSGPVGQPEAAPGYARRSSANGFKGGDVAGQFAKVALARIAQLATSSLVSLALASGDGSVMALSRRITRWRITASLKRKVFSSSARASPSHSILSIT